MVSYNEKETQNSFYFVILSNLGYEYRSCLIKTISLIKCFANAYISKVFIADFVKASFTF